MENNGSLLMQKENASNKEKNTKEKGEHK